VHPGSFFPVHKKTSGHFARLCTRNMFSGHFRAIAGENGPICATGQYPFTCRIPPDGPFFLSHTLGNLHTALPPALIGIHLCKKSGLDLGASMARTGPSKLSRPRRLFRQMETLRAPESTICAQSTAIPLPGGKWSAHGAPQMWGCRRGNHSPIYPI